MIDLPVSPEGAADPLRVGRDAYRRHAWQEAYERLSEADQAVTLAGSDLEALAEAAFFTARADVGIESRERAYKARQAEGEPVRAAFLAFDLGRQYEYMGKPSIGSGWIRRGEGLLEGQPETYAHGYLASFRSYHARASGDMDAALAYAEEAVAISQRTADADLQAFGRVGLGSIKIAGGATIEGFNLMEEASLAAINGELSPMAAGVACCAMIAACRDLTDYGRATEWLEATERYCERQSVTAFPGICRVHRAEIKAMSGAWASAESELLTATSELLAFHAIPPMADGLYAIADIRRLQGDFEGAEASLREAHGFGRSPQPALALIRLAEGKVKAASSGINAAVSEQTTDRWARVRLLPAQVEVAVAAGDLALARLAADELGRQVEGSALPAHEAIRSEAHGRVHLAEGDPTLAAIEFRTAIKAWRVVSNRYELARTRVLLAEALAALGDDDAADLELRAARDEFERLGARIDLAAAEATIRVAAERAASATQVRKTFMFTDIVGSTKLAEALGDVAWERVLRWHDDTLRGLFAKGGGEVVNPTGDGFFVAFDSARQAIDCARAIQVALAERRRTDAFVPAVRIGIHTAEANRRAADYSGVGVHLAARVAALADGGEIVATVATIDEVGDVAMTDVRGATVKGVTAPVQVASITWG